MGEASYTNRKGGGMGWVPSWMVSTTLGLKYSHLWKATRSVKHTFLRTAHTQHTCRPTHANINTWILVYMPEYKRNCRYHSTSSPSYYLSVFISPRLASPPSTNPPISSCLLSSVSGAVVPATLPIASEGRKPWEAVVVEGRS